MTNQSLQFPTTNLLEGIRGLFPLETCPWDDYFLRMSQTDFYLGRHRKKASKTYFIRKAPFDGAFAILGGLTAALRTLADFKFDNFVCAALKDQGYEDEFISFLKNDLQYLRLNVFASQEGSIFLPNEPVITWEGDLISVRLAEGIFTKNVNFPSLAMTKWRRVKEAASPGLVYEFARRRAQDDCRTSFYGYLGGSDITSNSEIRAKIKIKLAGTMGHEWIQSFGDEYEAFDKWLEINPQSPVLLVDTIDTLRSGVPNAIKAFLKHQDRIQNAGGIPGIRNDSGDLAYLTIEERISLDQAGLDNVWIYQTNDLDEYSIQAIKEQIFTHSTKAGKNPFEVISKIVWACGTNPGTCSDQPSIGGVAKLTTIEYNNSERAVIKLAHDNPLKTSIPGSNRSTYVWHNDEFYCCLVHNKNEQPQNIKIGYHADDEAKCIGFVDLDADFDCRQHLVYECGKPFESQLTFQDVKDRCKMEVEKLHWTSRRFQNAHLLKVSLSEKVFKLRQKLIAERKLIED